MTITAGRIAVLACALGAGACDRSTPVAPTPVTQAPPPAPSVPRTPVSFPPLSGPSRTFVFERELSYPVREFTRQSRIVLYDNGALALEYTTIPWTHAGQYRPADGGLAVLFTVPGDRYTDEPWDDAILTLSGDSLTIEYELMMQHADWENAVYVRRR